MSVPPDLQFFMMSEFRHPDLVDAWSARQLDGVRATYGESLTITDDARTADDLPPGSAGSNSLHRKGQAFDLRTRDKTEQQMWSLVDAIYVTAATIPVAIGGVELELVASSTDHHLHVGWFKDGRPSRLLIRAE